MFVTFLALLIGGSMLPIIVFSSGELVGLVGLEIPSRPAEKSSLRRGIGYGRTFTQAYIWFGWAAYCAWLAIRFGVEPDIAYPRVYHLIALLATGLPVAYLAVVSRKYVSSDEERGQLQRGTRIVAGFAILRILRLFRPPWTHGGAIRVAEPRPAGRCRTCDGWHEHDPPSTGWTPYSQQ